MDLSGKPPAPAAGTTVAGGRFRLGRRLGQGGWGAVFEATQAALGRPVALKLLRADGLADDEGAARRLVDEALAGARVRHPGLMEVIDAGVDPELGPWVAYELLPGTTLREVLEREGALGFTRALEQAARPLLGALGALHDAGVVHRDVKPENLLRTREGTYKLGDLGLAHFAGRSARTATGLIVGTPGYLAPEAVAGGQAPGPAADVYAAAVTVIEAATGRRPFGVRNALELLAEQARRDVSAGDLAALGLPAAAARALAGALRREPGDRPSTPELLASLEAAAGGAAEAVRPPLVPPPVPGAPRRRSTVAVLAAAAVALAALGLGRAPRPTDPTGPAASARPDGPTTWVAAAFRLAAQGRGEASDALVDCVAAGLREAGALDGADLAAVVEAWMDACARDGARARPALAAAQRRLAAGPDGAQPLLRLLDACHRPTADAASEAYAAALVALRPALLAAPLTPPRPGASPRALAEPRLVALLRGLVAPRRHPSLTARFDEQVGFSLDFARELSRRGLANEWLAAHRARLTLAAACVSDDLARGFRERAGEAGLRGAKAAVAALGAAGRAACAMALSTAVAPAERDSLRRELAALAGRAVDGVVPGPGAARADPALRLDWMASEGQRLCRQVRLLRAEAPHLHGADLLTDGVARLSSEARRRTDHVRLNVEAYWPLVAASVALDAAPSVREDLCAVCSNLYDAALDGLGHLSAPGPGMSQEIMLREQALQIELFARRLRLPRPAGDTSLDEEALALLGAGQDLLQALGEELQPTLAEAQWREVLGPGRPKEHGVVHQGLGPSLVGRPEPHPSLAALRARWLAAPTGRGGADAALAVLRSLPAFREAVRPLPPSRLRLVTALYMEALEIVHDEDRVDEARADAAEARQWATGLPPDPAVARMVQRLDELTEEHGSAPR